MGYKRSRNSAASPLQRKLYRLLEPAGNMARTTAGESGLPPSAAELRLSRVLDVVLVALIVMGLWVLGIVARPLNWWKVVLLCSCVAAYLLIFTVPFIRELLLLEIGDTELIVTGLLVGAGGAVIIEIVHRVLSRWRASRDGQLSRGG